MERMGDVRTNGDIRASEAPGLILVNSSGYPVYYSSGALALLSYPPHRRNSKQPLDVLPEEIESLLRDWKMLLTTPRTVEFSSGRRQYTCRAFSLVPDHSQQAVPGLTALLLERAPGRSVKVAEIAAQFHLTQREQEAVRLLTLGLTSKEIGARMNVSPNTVKAFFRMVMTKMAVTTRSGIVGKIARI